MVGTISQIGQAASQDALRRRIGEMSGQVLESDARRITEVGGQRATDILAQSQERAGDYRRQGAWRVNDIMRSTSLGVGAEGVRQARSGVQVGAGTAAVRAGAIRGEGDFRAGRERWLTEENASRTERWGNVSAQRIRENAASQSERTLGQAAIARLGGQGPGPNYGGILARGAANIAAHGVNIAETGQRHGLWDLS